MGSRSIPRRPPCARWPRLVPELWESPVGTAALAGRLNEHVTALNTISDRWFELAGQARRHADDYSQTVAATPKPQEFKDVDDGLDQSAGGRRPRSAASQVSTQRGQLEPRATRRGGTVRRGDRDQHVAQGRGHTTGPWRGRSGGGVPAGAGAGPVPKALVCLRRLSWPRRVPPKPARPERARVNWRRCCPPHSARSGVWRAAWRAWPARSRRHSCRPVKAWRKPPPKGCPDWRRRRRPTQSCPSTPVA